MKFSEFSRYLQNLENTTSRNKMTNILGEMFNNLSSEEIEKACYLSLGRLAPKYEGLRLDMAEKLMIRAIAQALNISEEKIDREYKKIGDLGDTIFELKKKNNNKENKKITVADVYAILLEIAEEEGIGSQERKINRMAVLIQNLDKLGAKYLVRIPLEKLRLGFSDVTVLDALSWMEKENKSLRPELERAFNVLADIGKIASIFKEYGIEKIKEVKSEVGIPIRAALAERLNTPEEILEKMDGKCALEPKYDGFRVQIHFDKNKKHKIKRKDQKSLFKINEEKQFVKVFSRNLDDTTHMFPEIVEAVQKLPVESIILDGEAIAYNEETGEFLSFQKTVQRKRKYDIKQKAKELPLKVFVFDVLYLNGKPQLNKSFKKRRKVLEDILDIKKDTILLTKQKIVNKKEQFKEFFNAVVSEGLEGLMAKKIQAEYQAGARNYTWVKYKAAMQSELADTVDCVVMGYYRGKGKRSKFGIGAFLVGVKQKEKFLTVSKIGTGVTDEQWEDIYKRLEKIKTEKKPKQYKLDKNITPDVWCAPELVMEIEADEITESPLHTAGLALRFPRLKKIRDDKDPDQITTKSELKKLYNL